MKVVFHHAAEEELRQAVDYYELKSPHLGADLLDELEHLLGLLDQYPDVGVVWRHQTRRIPLRRFPFFLIYQINGEQLMIVAVAHQRRRPGYWKSR